MIKIKKKHIFTETKISKNEISRIRIFLETKNKILRKKDKKEKKISLDK